jgi:hypothetical protein
MVNGDGKEHDGSKGSEMYVHLSVSGYSAVIAAETFVGNAYVMSSVK